MVSTFTAVRSRSDYVDTDTGEIQRGKIAPAEREHVRQWLTRFDGREDVAFALEGCSGWRFVVEELNRCGVEAHLAEPTDTATLRGRKHRAKPDRADARLQRELLTAGRLPESWIPPDHVLKVRAQVRLYKALADERKGWMQRVHATLFHQGAPAQADLVSAESHARLEEAELSRAGRQAVDVALRQIEQLDDELGPLPCELVAFGRRQTGCRAIQGHYGIGALLSVAIWEELGDCRRFTSSSDAVRHSGLDVTVWSSDAKRSKGHLARQGPASCAGRSMRLACPRPSTPHRTMSTSTPSELGSEPLALLSRSVANSADAAITPFVNSAMRPWRPRTESSGPRVVASPEPDVAASSWDATAVEHRLGRP